MAADFTNRRQPVIINNMDRRDITGERLCICRKATWCLWIVLLAGIVPQAQAEPAPRKGALLVASADLVDPNFYRTVILLTSYGEDGAMGLVLNRPTAILPRRILPGVKSLSGYNGPMYFGGPVMLDHILFLWRGEESETDGELVFGRVWLSASPAVLDSLAEKQTDAGSLRIYAGYAGWAPGQLEFELLQGGWHVVGASESMVFADDPGSVWQRLLPMTEPLTASLSP